MAEDGKMKYVIPAKRKNAETEQAGREYGEEMQQHIATREPYVHHQKVHAAVPALNEGVAEMNVRRAAPPGIAGQAAGSNQLPQAQSAASIDQGGLDDNPSVSPLSPLDLEHISTLSWHQVGLAAEAEESSLFGRFRQLALLGLVHDSEVEKMSAIGVLFAAVWMAARQDGTVPLSRLSSKKAADEEEWRWADLQFEAEDREDSIAGATRVLIGLGVLGEDFELELWGLGMVFAQRWFVASSTAETAGEGGSYAEGGEEFDWQLDDVVMARSDGWICGQCVRGWSAQCVEEVMLV